jgi:hypothetical protein
MELLDLSLAVLDDISDDLAVGGSVSRAGYATLHGTARFALTRRLAWGRAIVRPYMTLTHGDDTARFNLGAYFTSTPRRITGVSPERFEVAGYDILKALDTAVGEVYAVDAGVAYLTEVAGILAARGYTRVVVDQRAAASVLPSARVWPLEDRSTWLGVVNDLLGAVGYQGVWSDWDGALRLVPYETPATRPSEWTYDLDPETSIMDPQVPVVYDFFDAPNRWVFIRANNIDGAPPVEGDGVYTYVNEFVGDTSVEARGGLVNTKVMNVDAADHASLVAQAQITIDADMRVATKLNPATGPNPLHWHFDRLTVDHPDVGPQAQVLSTQWTLPLDGANMRHEWTVLT